MDDALAGLPDLEEDPTWADDHEETIAAYVYQTFEQYMWAGGGRPAGTIEDPYLWSISPDTGGEAGMIEGVGEYMDDTRNAGTAVPAGAMTTTRASAD